MSDIGVVAETPLLPARSVQGGSEPTESEGGAGPVPGPRYRRVAYFGFSDLGWDVPPFH